MLLPIKHVALGRFVATPAALAALTHLDMRRAIQRHQVGDWGELCPEDLASNDRALECGGRLLSAYHSEAGIKFYVITEHDRSVTTVLLPEDY
jgi:hypothetical protein